MGLRWVVMFPTRRGDTREKGYFESLKMSVFWPPEFETPAKLISSMNPTDGTRERQCPFTSRDQL